MRLLVCGGRNFTDVARLWRHLDKLDAECRIEEVIDGASDDVTGPHQGADYWAHQWALARDRGTIRQHADWKQYGRAAGPRRNSAMLNHKPDRVVATSGGPGTEDMIRKALSAGLKVERI